MTPLREPSSDPPEPSTARWVALVVGLGVPTIVLSLQKPLWGAIAAAVAWIAIRARRPLARALGPRLSRSETDQGLLAVLVAFVLLPLAPDVGVGPYGAINPQTLVRVALLVLAIGTMGHVAQRLVGARYGLVLAGFASGFVTSTGTIGAMGLRAAQDRSVLRASVGGAIASCIATVVEYALLVAAVDPRLLLALAWPLGLALGTAVFATLVTVRPGGPTDVEPLRGSAFGWLPAIAVAGASGVLSIAGAALDARVGDTGAIGVSAVAGFVDAHASTPSIATLHHAGSLATREAVAAIVAALTTNTASKIAIAAITRSAAFAVRVGIAVVAIAASAWLGFLAR